MLTNNNSLFHRPTFRPNGPVDQFGRDFKTYLRENPDESRRFTSAWIDGNVPVLMSIVQGFFDGLPDFQIIDTGARREASFSIPDQVDYYAQRHTSTSGLHLRC